MEGLRKDNEITRRTRDCEWGKSNTLDRDQQRLTHTTNARRHNEMDP